MLFASAFRLRLDQESTDESRRAATAEWQLELFEQQNPKQDDFWNRLFACVAKPFLGDNKLVMASLMQSFKGKVDLIYIDSTFDVGADSSMSVAIFAATFLLLLMKTLMEAMTNGTSS